MMGSLLKYHMAPIKDDRAFRALVKGDEFRIEFGEFLDWKIVLAAEYPEVDLFNSRGRQFPHRQFQDKIFRHKKFYKFNLKGSVFRNCEFSDSTLEEASLGDCLFEQCRFKNVIFTDVLLAGAQFRECTLENVVFERVIASISGMAPEKWTIGTAPCPCCSHPWNMSAFLIAISGADRWSNARPPIL